MRQRQKGDGGDGEGGGLATKSLDYKVNTSFSLCVGGGAEREKFKSRKVRREKKTLTVFWRFHILAKWFILFRIYPHVNISTQHLTAFGFYNLGIAQIVFAHFPKCLTPHFFGGKNWQQY